MKKILIIGATHGHEYLGVDIQEKLKKLNLKLVFLIGNPEAYEKRVAFIDSDLNRIFPGKVDGNLEEKIAFELNQKIKEYDLVIDIHSTNTIKNKKDATLIITKITPEIKRIFNVKIIK
jgi:succinylglutamate desuccinylase